MKFDTSSDLECVKLTAGKKCRGALTTTVKKELNREIFYGYLACGKCGTKYPVIHGIPVLMDNLGKYLKTGFNGIRAAISENKKDNTYMLMMTMRDIGKVYTKQSEITFTGQDIKHSGNTGVNGYFALHYQILENLRHTPLMKELVKLHRTNNQYEVIKQWLKGVELKKEKTLDIGCCTGGVTHLLAEKSKFAYGVDTSFECLLGASRVTKHFPEKQDTFKIKEAGGLKEKRINIKKADNIDFILASGDNLPFKQGLFKIYVAANVVDIARNNLNIIEESVRVLSKHGEAFISFVPYFRKLEQDKIKWDLDSRNIRREISGLDFYREHNQVPFLMRNLDNFFNVYDNCCMIGRKR